MGRFANEIEENEAMKMRQTRASLLRYYNKHVHSHPANPAPWGGELTTKQLKNFYRGERREMRQGKREQREYEAHQKYVKTHLPQVIKKLPKYYSVDKKTLGFMKSIGVAPKRNRFRYTDAELREMAFEYG
jgi:hypothetical protein